MNPPLSIPANGLAAAPTSGPIAPKNQKTESRKQKSPTAFTLVELLIVIAVIAIMASLVISAFSNAAADSRLVLAQQQQSVVQEALNSWIAYASASPRSLSEARAIYNAETNGLGRLALVRDYLDDATYAHLVGNTTNPDQVCSDAMVRTSKSLQITTWAVGSYPKAILQ